MAAFRLDLDKLERPRLRGHKVVARCPACAEQGADAKCEHLVIFDSGTGPFRCICDPQGAGSEHSRRIVKIAGVRTPAAGDRPDLRVVHPGPKLHIPAGRPLTFGELSAIATLRGWRHLAGLELLSQRGLLLYGEIHDAGTVWPSWVITDSSKRNAQARRLDGKPWFGIGNAKAKTLPGAQANWPIGAADIGDRPTVVLTEGGPDFCCALLQAWLEGLPVPKIAPVTMTGAAHSIPKDAWSFFAGKRVRIIEHRDVQGQRAGAMWADQLRRAGVKMVDGVRIESCGSSVKDLSDLICGMDDEQAPHLLEGSV